MAYTIHNTFETMADYLAYLQATPPAWDAHNCDSETERPSNFNGDVTYLQAITLAEFGWPEGRNLMSDVASDMSPEDLDVQVAEEIQIDVAGAYPVPALAVTGDPACMVDIQAVETPTRIIKAVVTLANPWTIDAKTLMSHGAAVLSYIDALENNGWRVDIWGRFEVTKNGNKVIADIGLKRAQDHLDIDTMAFALVHPAMLRRLFLRYVETFRKTQDAFKATYGKPEASKPHDCQIFIPNVPSNALADKDAAIRYVGTKLDKTLKPAA